MGWKLSPTILQVYNACVSLRCGFDFSENIWTCLTDSVGVPLAWACVLQGTSCQHEWNYPRERLSVFLEYVVVYNLERSSRQKWSYGGMIDMLELDQSKNKFRIASSFCQTNTEWLKRGITEPCCRVHHSFILGMYGIRPISVREAICYCAYLSRVSFSTCITYWIPSSINWRFLSVMRTYHSEAVE